MKNISKSKETVKVGLIAKYLSNEDTYKSVSEALRAAFWQSEKNVKIIWIDSEEIEKKGTKPLEGLCGIVIPGGFGNRGTEGKIIAAKYARENNVPYLGLCLGMQIAVIEFARNVLAWPSATSGEVDSKF